MTARNLVPPESHPIRAAAWMLGAIASFSAMAVAGREVSFELDTFEIMMYRSFIGLAIVLAVGGATGTLRQVRTDRLGTHLIRNISHFTGQNLWFYALALIPFAQVFAFEFSVPIWITLLAPFVLGERLTRTRIVAVAIGFAGILMVTRPWMGGLSWGIVAAFLCAIGFAGSAMFTKILTRRETITGILFWLTLMQAVFGVICAGYDGDVALPSADNAGWIVLIGIAGLTAHLCLTTALSVAPAVIVMPMDFTRLPIIALIGAVFYDEAIGPWIVLGGLVIFSANYFNILSERRAGRPRSVLAASSVPPLARRRKTD